MAQNNNEARTLREPLESRRSLQATVRPPTTYDNARSGYVERPHGAGRDMQALAGALSQFDRSLGGYLDQKLDRQIEEGTAEGNFILNNEGTDANGNMLEWKGLTEKNPELVNKNPWVQKGYEEARLQGLGLKFKKTVNDALIDSGMNNESDMAKVEQFYQTQADAFRKQNGLDVYEDKIMLAKNFSPILAITKEQLFNRHSQALEAQNEIKAMQSYQNLALQEIENGMDVSLNGGVRIPDHPAYAQENLRYQAERIMNAVSAATTHGVRNVNAAGMAMDIITTLAEKDRDDISALQLCDMIEINGIPLNNFEGVEKTRNALLDRHTARQAAALAKENAALERQILLNKRNLPGKALEFYMSYDQNTDGPITYQTLLGNGFSRNEAHEAMKTLNSMHADGLKSLMGNDEMITFKSTLSTAASLGMLDAGMSKQAIHLFGEDALAIIKTNTDATEGAMKEEASISKQLYSSFSSRFSKGAISADASAEDVLATALSGSKAVPRDYMLGILAGGHVVSIFNEMTEEARIKNKGAKLNPIQLQRLAMQAELQAQKELPTIFAKSGDDAKERVQKGAAPSPEQIQKKQQTAKKKSLKSEQRYNTLMNLMLGGTPMQIGMAQRRLAPDKKEK